MAVSGRNQQLTRSVLQASDEDLPICSPCENGGIEIEAHGFCSNCKEHLCEACYTSHVRYKQFRKHVLLDKSLMPREAPPPDDMCPKHPAQQLEYYCRTHNKLECSRCVNIHHRTCEDVSYIEDICDDIEETEEFTTLYRILTRIEHDAVQSQAKVKANLTDIQTNADEAKTSIRNFRKYHDQHLDKMEEALCAEADDTGARDKQTMETVSAECDALTSTVRSAIYIIDVSRKTQQKMRMFVQMKNTQPILAEWQKQMDDIASKNKIQLYKFEPEKQLQSMIEEGQNFGCLVVEGDTAKLPDPRNTGKVKATGDDQVSGRNSDLTGSFRFLLKGTVTRSSRRLSTSENIAGNTLHDIVAIKDDTITVVASTDTGGCNITGMVCVDDNTLAIADSENKSVKTVDLKQKKVKNGLSLEHTPNDITRINGNTMAVTCPDNELIQLVRVTVSGSLDKGQKIQAKGACWGICYIDTGGGRLAVSFIKPRKVCVLDMSGTVLNEFSSDAAGRPIFGMPFSITNGYDGSTIIVSDMGNGTVTGLTLDGAVKFIHRDDEILFPTGVAVGKGGEIYVYDSMSLVIHVISSEGSRNKVLLKEEDENTQLQRITYSNSKLFVSGENNEVQVYKIQYQ